MHKRVKRKRNGGDVIVGNGHQSTDHAMAMKTTTIIKQPGSQQVGLDRSSCTHTLASLPNGAGGLHNKAQSSLKARKQSLLEFRQQLPIWSHADSIRQKLSESHVLILVGETGSGKSTQVPQFLLDEPWCKGCIAVTQPRRVAAISLARRVAAEMGSALGSSSPASKVGYSVRFDTSVSPCTRIKYLTEGMLLQEMLHDPILQNYSAIVVDEVHERSMNVDLIIGFLQTLSSHGSAKRRNKPLKIVVMSATADVDMLVNFFSRGHAVMTSVLDAKSNNEVSSQSLVSTCHVQGRMFPVTVTYLSEPTLDFVEAALKRIFQIHIKEPLPGDVLVFLTGQDTVESLEKLVNDYADGMSSDLPKILALPLFAALSQAAQQRVFHKAPPRTRKVILSTNIAETSVTVPGVRFVIDSGKMKVKQFRSRLGLESLLVKPISKSSAIQRKGRAGRESPGQCYRLYTSTDYATLQHNTTPEILRCDLSDAILGMKARNIDDVMAFPFLDCPSRQGLEKALLQLLQLGALDAQQGKITQTGIAMSRLPLTPALACVIMEAAKSQNEILMDVINIVSCLTVETIFLNPMTEERKEQAEEARKDLFRRDGDHLTLLATVRGYAMEKVDRKAWAQRYHISHRALQNVMDIRKQLFQQCQQLKLVSGRSNLEMTSETTSSVYTESRNQAIIKCLLSGFASNVARLMPDGSYKTLVGNQVVAIHPSSVLFGRKIEAIFFTEFVFTNKSYGRNVSAVRLGWIEEALGRR